MNTVPAVSPAPATGGGLPLRFRDRREAGERLTEALTPWLHHAHPLVLGLPRGGIPVAAVVADALGAPLDVCVVRKLGAPQHEEIAIGAIALGGIEVLNEPLIRALRVRDEHLRMVRAHQAAELQRREVLFRGNAPPPHVRGRSVFLVDDGLVTGATMAAAIAAVRRLAPRRIIVGVPVAPLDVMASLSGSVDALVAASTPAQFHGVGHWYDDFAPTGDEEVRTILARFRAPEGSGGAGRFPGYGNA